MILLVDSEKAPHLNVEEVCHCAGINEETLCEIVDYAIVVPIAGEHPKEWLFCVAEVETVKKAARIHRDLSVDWMGIALILTLLGERTKLEAENEKLKNQLSRFLKIENYQSSN